MMNWHGVTLLVSEWSLKFPLHNATIASVLYALVGLLFHKFGFFMDGLRTLCGQNVELLNVKLVVQIVTTGL